MMDVTNLFDGMSCGQIALKKAGIKVREYRASEVDKHAIKVTKDNFPNTIHIGDVRQVSGYELMGCDLLMAGSPCQGFSVAGKQLNFEDPRSKLFFEFVRVKKEMMPKYFLLENVVMKKEWIKIITDIMEVEPIMINSALVSAQNRKRLYWTNIPVTQPDDKNIFLEDIIEQDGFPVIKNRGVVTPKPNKSQCLDANYFKGVDNHGQRTMIFNYSSSGRGNGKVKGRYTVDAKKSLTLTAAGYSDRSFTGIYDGDIKKLTVLECKRLQTVPDDYIMNVSNSQAYKMLGNGWTIDVIAHILKGIK